MVVEISRDPSTSEIRVHDIWCAFDAGTVVQPKNLVAQIEGSLLFGMGVALYEQVNIKDGAADESNFGEYRVLRMSDLPEMHVTVVQSDAPPSGVGEAGVPAIATGDRQCFRAADGQAAASSADAAAADESRGRAGSQSLMRFSLRLPLCLAAAAISLISLPRQAFAEQASDMDRGEYMAHAANCAACHTAPRRQALRRRLPMMTPLGAIYTTNITPDPSTGIGQYSLEEFGRALRQGVAKDGHHLYPAMPYPSYAKLTDEDVGLLYGYFQRASPR